MPLTRPPCAWTAGATKPLGYNVKKLILLCSTAIAFPTAAFAQSTGTTTTEEEKEIVVTGTRAYTGIDGIVVPDTTKAKALITQELIQKQSAGQTVLNVINLVPGVNFTNSDPYGSSGGNIRIRGFDGNRISLTFDGVPLNDSGNYAIFSNQQLDPELIEQVNVGLGVTDVDSPTASAAGGTVNYRTLIPTNQFGARIAGSLGDHEYGRVFGMIQTGQLTSFGTKAWFSASDSSNEKFKGPGKISKRQYNARVYQPLGAGGDFISVAGHYNRNRNNFYRNPSVSDLRTLLNTPFGVEVIPNANASADNPIKIGYIDEIQESIVEDFDNLATCSQAFAVGGTAQVDNSACSNYFGVRINPSNTGNVRGQSRFTLSDALILTVDPSYQYVLANGGGSTVFAETNRQIRGNLAVAGVDLNGDGDILDGIRLLTPNNTNTNRYGLTSSLIYDIARDHRVRVAYTYDRAHHRQTGEYGFLDANSDPESVFGGRNGTPVLDAAGNILQQRDRTSIALLNQISGQYIGKFFDRRLRVEIGVRRPFFKRNLDQNCYTFASGSGFAYCSTEVLGTTPIPTSAGNFIVPANFAPALGASVPSNAVYAPFKADYKFGKLLPSIGFTYLVGGPVSIFGSFAKGFSAPRTDNLYRRPVVQITPEETNAFDLGARYTNRLVQAQATVWKIDYKNRIVSSFDPDLGISLDRNVGKVKSWGIDGSVAFRPIKPLSLLAIASYIDTELQEDIAFGSVTFNPRNPGASANPPPGTYYCAGAAPTALNPVAGTCAATGGKRVAETPKWQFGGRANLEVGAFEFGVQAKRVGSRFATDINDVKVKGYTLVDFDARVSMKPLGFEKSYFQLNVTNVFGVFYFGNISTQINAGGNPNFSVGGPRTISGTLNIGI